MHQGPVKTQTRRERTNARRIKVSDLRFLLWNMERMNDLFVFGDEDDPPAFRPDDDEPAHHRGATVRERRGHWGVALGNQGHTAVLLPSGYLLQSTPAGVLNWDSHIDWEWQTLATQQRGCDAPSERLA